MHLIEDLSSEKVRRHLSQAIVELYELSHFEVRSDASSNTCSNDFIHMYIERVMSR